MTHNQSLTSDIYLEPSLKKQQLFSKYAKGELSWSVLSDEIAKIKPPLPSSWNRKIVVIAFSLFLALLPPWAKRDN